MTVEPLHDISKQCGMCDQQRLRPAFAFAIRLNILLTEHHLGFLSLKGGYTGSSESTLV